VCNSPSCPTLRKSAQPLSSTFGAMNLRPSQILSLLAAAYVAIVVGGIFVRFAGTGDLYTLRYSLTLTVTLIVTILGSVIALGLWRGHAWAWWLGLTAVAVQLTRFSPCLLGRLKNGNVPVGSSLIKITGGRVNLNPCCFNFTLPPVIYPGYFFNGIREVWTLTF